MMRILFIAGIVLTVAGCGGDGHPVDAEGLIRGDTGMDAFARACQLYFRGSLSRAMDEFNGVIYRFPDSPLVEDARLAVRRIEADLTAGEIAVNPDNMFLVARSAVLVGRQSALPAMDRIASAMTERGLSVEIYQDDGAPEMTIVLYPEGELQEAGEIADSLSVWLTRPETVPVQPGGELTHSIVPDYEGILVIVGTDATVSPHAPGS
jgi:hypothetical protein